MRTFAEGHARRCRRTGKSEPLRAVVQSIQSLYHWSMRATRVRSLKSACTTRLVLRILAPMVRVFVPELFFVQLLEVGPLKRAFAPDFFGRHWLITDGAPSFICAPSPATEFAHSSAKG
jgi:hypothetical protein